MVEKKRNQRQYDFTADGHQDDNDSDEDDEGTGASTLSVQTIRKRITRIYKDKNPAKQQEVQVLR